MAVQQSDDQSCAAGERHHPCATLPRPLAAAPGICTKATALLSCSATARPLRTAHQPLLRVPWAWLPWGPPRRRPEVDKRHVVERQASNKQCRYGSKKVSKQVKQSTGGRGAGQAPRRRHACSTICRLQDHAVAPICTALLYYHSNCAYKPSSPCLCVLSGSRPVCLPPLVACRRRLPPLNELAPAGDLGAPIARCDPPSCIKLLRGSHSALRERPRWRRLLAGQALRLLALPSHSSPAAYTVQRTASGQGGTPLLPVSGPAWTLSLRLPAHCQGLPVQWRRCSRGGRACGR